MEFHATFYGYHNQLPSLQPGEITQFSTLRWFHRSWNQCVSVMRITRTLLQVVSFLPAPGR